MKRKAPENTSTVVRVDLIRNRNFKIWASKHIIWFVQTLNYFNIWTAGHVVLLTSVFCVFISALRFYTEVQYWSWSFSCCCNWCFPIAVSSSFFLASFSSIMKGPWTEPCCKSFYLKNQMKSSNLTCIVWGCMYVISISNPRAADFPQVCVFFMKNGWYSLKEYLCNVHTYLLACFC